MADTTYKSAYTGAQIDKAVGTVLENDIPNLAVKATAAASKAETAAARAEEAATATQIYINKDSQTYEMLSQEATLFRRSCVITQLSRVDGASGVRLSQVQIKTTGAGNIKLAVYKLIDNGDGTGVLTCVDVIGTVKASGVGGAGLIGIDYYTEEEDIYLLALADAEIVGNWELTGVTLDSTPHFDDTNLYSSVVGSTISCSLDTWDAPFMACAYVKWNSVSVQTISEFAEETNTRLDSLEGGSGGTGGTTAVVTAVDLSKYDSDGIIEETYSDGSVITYTMEFDTDGNPIRITDSNGNETVLTW